MDDSNKQKAWKILRPLDQELATILEMVNNMLVMKCFPLNYGLDIPRWNPGKGGMYLEKCGYLSLLEINAFNFPIKKAWMKDVTPKLTHFLWLIFRK